MTTSDPSNVEVEIKDLKEEEVVKKTMRPPTTKFLFKWYRGWLSLNSLAAEPS